MILSADRGFLFLKTAKTAGTSVEIALSRVCGDRDVITPIPAADEALRLQRGGRAPQNCLHPVTGAKAFNHMSARAAREFVGVSTWNSVEKFVIERNPWDAVVSQYFWMTRGAGTDGGVSFRSFVLDFPHIVSMAARNARIYRIRGAVVVDRVLRYEALQTELAALWSDLALPGDPDLPQAKGGVRPPGHYREVHDADTRAKVAQVFAFQIDQFGYEF